ncbi:MAG: response regulator with CheY-like receiver domain and winged-helix DNA-binding domain [Solirubrobacterales bacterium]|jgi:two-component system response regulator RegX3|nr:response regulator with CheY-like receiver domain and winged-helix DNA-binding domain [Solirubrobacterales bacterium]
MPQRILLVDDDLSVHEVMRAYLEREGFLVYAATNGRDGLDLTHLRQPDLIILDLDLPDVRGDEICRDVRRRSDVPIVMLTAAGSLDERVAGFTLGTDDYVVKPFSPRELVARVHALLRRAGAGHTPLGRTHRFDAGALEIDTVRHEVAVEGTVRDLTPSEYKLLSALAQYPGRVYSRFELINRMQGHDFTGYERTVDAHVKNLRRKVEPDPGSPRYVQTVRGVGYRLGAAPA